jgi:hypothetical protein
MSKKARDTHFGRELHFVECSSFNYGYFAHHLVWECLHAGVKSALWFRRLCGEKSAVSWGYVSVLLIQFVAPLSTAMIHWS